MSFGKHQHQGMTHAASLFPFICVLFGVIGVMALLMAGQAALSLANADQIVDRSEAGESEREPIYIECRADGFLVHPQRLAIPLGEDEIDQFVKRQRDVTDPAWDQMRAAKRRDEIPEGLEDEYYRREIERRLESADDPWLALLEQMLQHRESQYPVLLVRPDGLRSLEIARYLLRDARIDHGYDPVYATGEIYIRGADEPDPDAAPQPPHDPSSNTPEHTALPIGEADAFTKG